MRQKPSRSTIKEVASAAGVSTQTVSRVMNNRPDVASETRKRVKDIVKKLGYQPSALARSLISQRSYTLGVVTAGLRYIGPSRTLSGIASAAENAGYSLLLKELPSFDTNDVTPIFQTLLSRHVDGIIWAVPKIGENHNWVNRLPLEVGVPVVYLTMEPQENNSVVSVNNYAGGQMAVSHLLEQGYQNIGHISGPMDWWEARQRMLAWKDTLMEAGHEVRDHQWVEGNWSSASGAQAVKNLFLKYPEMDAIFVANDQMALSVLKAAAEKALRIPADMGIVGFDNIPESADYLPALTTVQQDQNEIARVAMREMIEIIESSWQGLGPVKPKSIMLEPTLVVRKSSLRRQAANGKGGETNKEE
ncbi:MAG TPA: LacI family DNA-binding transcriptional regulator [Anaerolineales bacterium]|nr:LacI family DNA-binding transcriptional regulator [Anaerolineales bacterium]